jgi:hypothetical protein
VINGEGRKLPAGDIIDSRPWGKDGVGTSPTGIVEVNEEGQPVDKDGNVIDIDKNPEKAAGHVLQGGTFETRYNPIIKGKAVKKKR